MSKHIEECVLCNKAQREYEQVYREAVAFIEQERQKRAKIFDRAKVRMSRRQSVEVSFPKLEFRRVVLIVEGFEVQKPKKKSK